MSAATISTRLAGPRGGRLRANLRHTGALVRRNGLRIKADPESMFDAVLMPIVFTTLFVYVFGGAVSGSQHQYIQYIVPGMLAQGGIMLAMAVGTGLNSDFKTGVMDRFRTLPIARSSVLVAKAVTELGRMLISSMITLGFAMAIGFRVHAPFGHVLAAIAIAVLFGSALSWVSMLLGMAVKSPQTVQGVGMLVVMPLQFGSSIFAPTRTMPGWLQGFTRVNPMSALADAGRNLLNGGPLTHSIVMVLAWSIGLTAVFAPLAVARFRKRT